LPHQELGIGCQQKQNDRRLAEIEEFVRVKGEKLPDDVVLPKNRGIQGGVNNPEKKTEDSPDDDDVAGLTAAQGVFQPHDLVSPDGVRVAVGRVNVLGRIEVFNGLGSRSFRGMVRHLARFPDGEEYVIPRQPSIIILVFQLSSTLTPPCAGTVDLLSRFHERLIAS
jgi:hypothetical protein